MIGIQQARPPFVEFKQIPKHDPHKSEELGYRVTKNVDMAFIMQPGSKDCVEIEATKWLESIKRKLLDAAPDAYPQDWVDGFRKKYEMWKEGLDAPLNGTSIREWPALSPAEVENFIACRVMTIEDVAAMTEECIARVGMGSRGLRDKAREWLQGKDVAKHAMEENASLRQTVEELTTQIAELTQRLNAPADDRPKRGRPAKLTA